MIRREVNATVLVVKRIKSTFFNNKSARQILFKNTFWLGQIEVISKIIMFFVTIVVIRSYGPIDFGRLNIAFSYSAIILVLSNLGLDTLITREIAKNPQKVQQYLSNILALKLVISMLLLLTVVILTPLLHLEYFVLQLFYLAVIYGLCQSINNFFSSLFLGIEAMEYVFFTRLVHYLGILVAVILIT